MNQKGVTNYTTYYFPASVEGEGPIIGLQTLIRDGVITSTDIVSGHRVRRQRESVIDPEKAEKKAEQAFTNLSKDQQQALLAKWKKQTDQ